MPALSRLAVTKALASVILIMGLSQMAGFVFDLRPLRAIGAVSAITPLPKVFADVDGVETFASRFTLEFTRPDGRNDRLEITLIPPFPKMQILTLEEVLNGKRPLLPYAETA